MASNTTDTAPAAAAEPAAENFYDEWTTTWFSDGDFENLNDYGAWRFHPVIAGDLLGPDGRFRVVDKLGHGGYGTVWLCRDNLARKWRAVKILCASGSRLDCPDLQTTEHFRGIDREVLENKGIVLPLEHFWINDGPNRDHLCFVLPFLGPCVRDVASLYAHCPEMLKDICFQLVEAMEFLHANGGAQEHLIREPDVTRIFPIGGSPPDRDVNFYTGQIDNADEVSLAETPQPFKRDPRLPKHLTPCKHSHRHQSSPSGLISPMPEPYRSAWKNDHDGSFVNGDDGPLLPVQINAERYAFEQDRARQDRRQWHYLSNRLLDDVRLVFNAKEAEHPEMDGMETWHFDQFVKVKLGVDEVDQLFDLLMAVFRWNPENRASAADLLNHAWFEGRRRSAESDGGYYSAEGEAMSETVDRGD
ncbi:hypothetical protein B0T22DRAFT_523908 [Podospora appendiculata]|uniref:non-specific serine/threonine protein kinase n=1 Tax=Podospora appendiculata TaxID=314037 RepID=A0AAE0WZ37_9PEZI|nr:hypothetical protein B0T22DRAFT_523908 [Podospora appendiculata]